MTDPQKEYIIPYELWKEIGQLLFKLEGSGTTSAEDTITAHKLMVCLLQCRCPSYSSAKSSEKVLDELEEKMDKRADEHHLFLEILKENGETNTEATRTQHQRLYALDEVYEWIAELRQQERER